MHPPSCQALVAKPPRRSPVHVHVRGRFGTTHIVAGASELRADYVDRLPHSRRALDDDADPVFVEVTSLVPV